MTPRTRSPGRLRLLRTEVADLQPVASALRDLDPTQLDAAEPPAALGDRVMQHVHGPSSVVPTADPRRRLAGALLVAASVAVAFGAGTWWAGPRADPPVIAVALNLDAPGIQAAAGLVRHTWGTELKLEATGLTDGGSYTVTFLRDDGTRVGAGSFLGTGPAPLRCSVNAALPVDAATEVMITDDSGALVMDADLR